MTIKLSLDHRDSKANRKQSGALVADPTKAKKRKVGRQKKILHGAAAKSAKKKLDFI